MPAPWYAVENIDEIDSPALLVFADRVQENIARMIRYAGGPEHLRPHVKTHKMAEVIRLQVAAGITKFKCATIAEAEMVAQCGAPDVLLAYALVGPKVQRYAALAAKYPRTRFSALVDDESEVAPAGAAMKAAGATVELLIDLDIGMGRTGIAPGARAEELYRLLAKHAGSPGIRPGGLHAYDGHIRDINLDERIAHGDAAFAPAAEFRKRLEAAGLSVPRVVAGGSPSFPVHFRRPDVECSPGTCIFWDTGYGSRYPDLDFLHAAVLVTRVISKPASGRLCLDLGYKAVSPDQPEKRVEFPDLPDAKTIVHNEEHLAVATSRADQFKVGDVLYGIPVHVCPTVALHQYANVVRNGRVVERWAVVARDRTLTV
jgi:D-serine deaminase-like pyridoxal phosphate-dependent protein